METPLITQMKWVWIKSWLVVWNSRGGPNPVPDVRWTLPNEGRPVLGSAMPGVFPHTFAESSNGDRIHIVGRLLCWDDAHEVHYFRSLNDKVLFHVTGLIDGSKEVFTFLNVQLARQYPVPLVVIDKSTKIFQHEPPSWESIHAVIELCSGFGGMSQGLTSCGFHPVVAVDFNEKMCQLYSKQCATETIVGEVNDVETICQIWHRAKGAGTIAAGFACQPFSLLGDQRGGEDMRAQSLRGILQIAFLAQVQVVILECVTPAATNQFVRDEIQRFLDVSGFSCSQTELQLSDVWPSRRSRSWWLLTSSFIGKVPLVPWPKSHAITKVSQVLPYILPWDVEDEAALALLPAEVISFGADSEAYVKYLLNFAGCAPCALHAWGSQVVACQCGCRAFGLSPQRLQEKGLFGLLVFSAADSQSRILRHIHPCECNALNGFDPVIDFGPNPRLTLAASGQMASPLQTAWIFATLAERIQSLKQKSAFPADAMLQALQSWTLMRCRQVWPIQCECIADDKMSALIGFWQGYEHLSIHELMHPPRWPALAGQQICIASVLDLIIREKQSHPVIPKPLPTQIDHDAVMTDVEEGEPTPWLETPDPVFGTLPEVMPDECVVVFLHEHATPIKFAVQKACTVEDIIQAQTKLTGEVHVRFICNQHGVELPLTHEVGLGQLICIRCAQIEERVDKQGSFWPEETQVGTPDVVPAKPSCIAEPVDPPCVSPTVVWSQPICVPDNDPIHATKVYDVGEQDAPHVDIGNSLLSAAPLLQLREAHFLQLQTPVVMSMKHLWALRHQLLSAEDRWAILQNQQGVWADDEFRFHLRLLSQQYAKYQQGFDSPSKQCTVLDPLLFTGWVHHGFDQCSSWCKGHPEVKTEGCHVISCCMIDGHWIPVIFSPVAGNLQVVTWDDPARDLQALQGVVEGIGSALGFSHVFITRHHRLFFSSDKCGAMAVAFLHHALLNSMLPTCHEEVVIIHDRLRESFASAVRQSKVTHRPWIWGAGDQHTDPPELSMPPDAPASSSSQPTGPSLDVMAGSFSHHCISQEERLEFLRSKGRQFGDDEIRFHLLKFLRTRETQPPTKDASEKGFVVMDPLLLATWDTVGKGICEVWCRANKESISQGLHVVAIFFTEDHWFPVWFNYHASTIVAHRIADDQVSSETIMPMLSVLQVELGFQASVEHVMPNPLPPHNLCGAAALAFIGHLMLGSPLPQSIAELDDIHVSLKAEFVEAVFQGTCCICPVVWGSGPFSVLTQQLSEELVKHGVPVAKAEQRAQQAIKAIGSDNVSTALKSKNPWRSLKAVGSNVRFQFLLPDELDAAIQANKENPVGRKAKPQAVKTKPAMPDRIDPAKLALPDGTFRVQGQVVPHIAVQQVGPVACGVVLITLEDALPYLKAGKHVSSEPLALVVVAPVGTEVATELPHAKITLPCMCAANREPLLAEATLVQLGQGIVEKHIAANTIELDQLEVVTLKVMVYHDEFAGQGRTSLLYRSNIWSIYFLCYEDAKLTIANVNLGTTGKGWLSRIPLWTYGDVSSCRPRSSHPLPRKLSSIQFASGSQLPCCLPCCL